MKVKTMIKCKVDLFMAEYKFLQEMTYPEALVQKYILRRKALKVNNAKYELTAVRPDQYPPSLLPEICFVGRSNVGKSSLINSLLNRKNLARVGATPGKTREINFYNIDEKLYFVDLPGYGFASVSKTKKTVWGGMVDIYLTSRPQLKLVIMLVDIRHTPSSDDILMYEWLSAFNVPNFVIATKGDKINRSQINLKLKEIKKVLSQDKDIKIIPFSSHTKNGKDEVWNEIDDVVIDSSAPV